MKRLTPKPPTVGGAWWLPAGYRRCRHGYDASACLRCARPLDRKL